MHSQKFKETTLMNRKKLNHSIKDHYHGFRGLLGTGPGTRIQKSSKG